MMMQEPSLAYGAFNGCLEEWIEGMLTLEWMESKRVLSFSELGLRHRMSANTSAQLYVGALSDFTGEIGRLAVQFATARDAPAVSSVLQTDIAVVMTLTRLNYTGRFNAKVDAAVTNMKKVEDIRYDIALQQLAGGRLVESFSAPVTAERAATAAAEDE